MFIHVHVHVHVCTSTDQIKPCVPYRIIWGNLITTTYGSHMQCHFVHNFNGLLNNCLRGELCVFPPFPLYETLKPFNQANAFMCINNYY